MAAETKDESLYIECDCHSFTHLVRLSILDWGDGFQSATICLALNHYRPWYKRVLPAIGYLFGKRGADYDECIVAREQVDEFVAWAGRLKELHLEGKRD